MLLFVLLFNDTSKPLRFFYRLVSPAPERSNVLFHLLFSLVFGVIKIGVGDLGSGVKCVTASAAVVAVMVTVVVVEVLVVSVMVVDVVVVGVEGVVSSSLTVAGLPIPASVAGGVLLLLVQVFMVIFVERVQRRH